MAYRLRALRSEARNVTASGAAPEGGAAESFSWATAWLRNATANMAATPAVRAALNALLAIIRHSPDSSGFGARIAPSNDFEQRRHFSAATSKGRSKPAVDDAP